ncbi:MAG TPA: type VI secretion protein IcmF/TssM N-terminal domain-containing protein, partial [Pyrinomonadaceae bacterium]|nr:type VI secretion protein IcmF/TssM N-terminal domain-containing protein [Pyrinomonadaceae bacterium]
MLSSPGIYILLVVLLLALGLIFLYVVIRKARQTPAAQEVALVAPGDDPPQMILNASSLGLKLSFSRAMRRIRASGKGYLYRIPWYLMIGEAGSGKTTLLSNTGMELLSDAPGEQQTGVKQGLNWFFFDQGIVLDVAGEFVLREDGATSNARGWNHLSQLLRRYRPERPLDGIILTIPSSDLTGAANQNPEFRLRLEKKAQRLYSKLVDVQKQLGLSLPVYVLVTKCDEVTGFKSLCQEMPERRDEMVGWSSPYTREIAYRPEWVTEAFQNLHSYLFELQIEVFAQRGRIPHSDEFFMLPSEMQEMRAPLQIYLNQIFRESVYHDPFFLRGIYFCGDGEGEALPSTVLPAPAPEKKQAFLEHLFERKIFQEDSLARPINRTALSRNRMVLAAQALSLAIPIIGVLGILATYPTLKEREAMFYAYLTREEQDLKAIKAEKQSGFKDEQSLGREARLFEAMSNMSGKNLFSPFIPGSWFSRVDEQSGSSISSAYQFVVYDSLRRR